MNDATGMPQTAVVIGGSSDIARETLGLLAGRRLEAVVLAGRDVRALEAVAAEITSLGVRKVECLVLDVTDTASLEDFADEAASRLGHVDLVLVAAGVLGEADLDVIDATAVAALGAANFTGPAAATMAFSRVLRRQGTGRIVVLSSVAGVRVRKANFVYGSGKAGLDGFALGLGDALEGSGVDVMVVRPGFVRTKMTEGRPEAPLAVEARTVAEAIVRGLEKGSPIVWVPPVLRVVFAVFKLLPRAVWRRIPG